jgi:hypothetical protein
LAADDIDIEVYSVANLRDVERLRDIGEALDSNPQFVPNRFGPSDPPRGRVGAMAIDLPAALKKVGDRMLWWLLARTVAPRVRSGWIKIWEAEVRHLPHEIDLEYEGRWFQSAERIDALAAYFHRLCMSAHAFYAFATPTSARDHGMPNLEEQLPGLYWLTWFGPAFTDLWGSRLDAVASDRSAAGTLVQCAPSPFAYEVASTTRDFSRLLAPEAFRSSGGETLRSHAVPRFEEHRRAAESLT